MLSEAGDKLFPSAEYNTSNERIISSRVKLTFAITITPLLQHISHRHPKQSARLLPAPWAYSKSAHYPQSCRAEPAADAVPLLQNGAAQPDHQQEMQPPHQQMC